MNRAKQFSTGSAESVPQSGRADCSAGDGGATGSAESAPQSGQEDPLVRLMRRFGMSVTRENYVNLAFLGEPPEMDAELEAILPPELRER